MASDPSYALRAVGQDGVTYHCWGVHVGIEQGDVIGSGKMKDCFFVWFGVVWFGGGAN